MSARPAYFEEIRLRAAQTWKQLEDNPEIAAPWHQLFKQVQSPRHILSELLQNADDAGATEAIVHIKDDAFIFHHNGEDFRKEHFASLCKFGYSNKRALHTIGFRGIGFKSTFSLGDRVELFTPTLSVAFDQNRFTEPFWLEEENQWPNYTTVRVAFSDQHRRKEVEKNLAEWLKSPISLLFFRNIRRIRINDKEVHWGSFGPGPVKDSEWLALHDKPEKTYLLARSEPENFPDECLREIRQERLLTVEQDMQFPPCQIEIVVGVEGRLFVVLPTGVKTDLPFAVNAPFIQDPARLKIKDPETSPTNRWLLERAGRLAGKVMLEWLGRTGLPAAERADSYNVMPDLDREKSDLEGVCGAIVEEAFEPEIKGKQILIADDGSLVKSGEASVLPSELFDVWQKEQVIALFDDQGRLPLSHHVSAKNLEKLKNWKAIEETDHQDVLSVLEEKHLPQPATWRQLLTLWAYIDRLLTSYEYYCEESELRIVPVQGKDILHSASKVVRLGEKRMVPSEDDWKFLGDHLSVLNQNWTRFLTEQRRNAESDKDKALGKLAEAAGHVFEEIGLDEPSDTGKVIDSVAASFFSGGQVTLKDAIRLAQIAAKLGAQVGGSFKFACQDRKLRGIGKTVLYDEDGSLSLLLPDDWADKHVLHADYVKHFSSCTREEWDSWIGTGRAGLAGFVPLEQSAHHYWSRKSIDAELARRSFSGRFAPRYSNPSFRLTDWDFDEEIWAHWEELEADMPSVWGRIAERVLSKPSQWSSHLTATVTEEASNGHTSRCVREGLVPSWMMKLRGKPCLRDTHGTLRKPEELLLRSPQTEALMDVEPFVHGQLDSEASKPILKLLGASDQPTGPEKLLVRLQALASAGTPPAHEVEKWYRRLDQLLDGCSTELFHHVRSTFEDERIILSENGAWENSHGVFLSAGEEDVPDTPLIRGSVKDLSLWRKIGVGERPTVDLAIEWVSGLPTGKPVAADEVRRVKALLARYPTRIWNECGHWMSLSGEWLPVEDFAYGISMQTLTPWSHLHQWVKQKTADLQRISAEVTESEPFNLLPPLAAHIEERFRHDHTPDGRGEKRVWLNELGRQIRRVKLEDSEETARIRAFGAQLSKTLWVTSGKLEIVPYIDGKPAGAPRAAEVLWLGNHLYAEDKPLGKLAKSVAQEIGKAFRRNEIVDAIKMCFERAPEFVASYMEENFDLVPEGDLGTDGQEADDLEVQGQGGSQKGPDTSEVVEEPASPADGDYTSGDEEFTDTLESESDDADESGVDQDDKPDETEESNETLYDAAPPAPRKPRVLKPSIMERFALSKGFRKDSDNHFFNEKGSVIGKANGSLFPWEERTASGDIAKCYWPKDHCLEREPLQLEADIWSVLEQRPDTYVLVLTDAEGEPVEVSGHLLTDLLERGVLALHPSTYRLEIEHEKQQ